MIQTLRAAAAAACLTLLAAGSALAQGAAPTPKPAPLTILVSIDGFRADYLKRGKTPALAALVQDGVSAAMRPSFPSLTFPNHYKLVTGLRPDKSGITDNTMEDPAKPGVVFSMGRTDISHDPFWWDQAEPIWVTAEKSGVRSATMFWPGADLPIRGVQAHDWKMYDKKMSPAARVDDVLGWLDRPQAERPRFVTLYFDAVDTAGHYFGPDSAEVDNAIAVTDADVGRLLKGLAARNLLDTADVIVVADHGMASTSQARTTYLSEFLPTADFHTVTQGAVAGIRATPGHEDEVAKALLAPHEHMTCWAKADIPAKFHYGKNARVPPFVCLGETGWVIQAKRSEYKQNLGSHGFDPYDPTMAAVFVAHGPSFRHGVTLPMFDNVDVYPLLAALIGVKPQPNDGNLTDLAAGLAR